MRIHLKYKYQQQQLNCIGIHWRPYRTNLLSQTNVLGSKKMLFVCLNMLLTSCKWYIIFSYTWYYPTHTLIGILLCGNKGFLIFKQVDYKQIFREQEYIHDFVAFTLCNSDGKFEATLILVEYGSTDLTAL